MQKWAYTKIQEMGLTCNTKNDLVKMQKWAYTKIQEMGLDWKMPFNPDKQAQEVIFSGKIRKGFLYLIISILIINCINDKINKTLTGVGLLRKLSTLLPRQS